MQKNIVNTLHTNKHPNWKSKILTVMMDKCNAIRNAVIETNPTTIILSCYFHMMKTVKNYFSGVSNGNNYWEMTAKNHLQLLHLSVNHQIFNNLAEIIIEKWRIDGFVDAATKFRDGYLCDQWKNWYIGSIPEAGQGNTNNLLESFNGTIKALVPKSTI